MVFSANMLDCYLINMYIEFSICIMNSVLGVIVYREILFSNNTHQLKLDYCFEIMSVV